MPEAKMVEVSENDYENLKQAKALMESLWNSKTTGQKFKRVLKEHNPNFSIPEIDVVDEARKPIDEKLTAHEKTIEALQKRLDERESKEKDEKEQTDLKKEIEDVRKKFGLTDEGFDKMINRMKEKKSYDPEAAASWVKSQEPKSKLASESKLGLPGKIDLYGSNSKDEAWADLNRDPMGFFDKEAERIFENPENYKEMGGAL